MNAYPLGGMTALTEAMRARAEANNVRFFLNSSATCVRRATGTGSTQYEVRTSARSFRARKFLFLSAPTPALLNASKVGGTAVQTAAAKALRHVSTMRTVPQATCWTSYERNG